MGHQMHRFSNLFDHLAQQINLGAQGLILVAAALAALAIARQAGGKEFKSFGQMALHRSPRRWRAIRSWNK